MYSVIYILASFYREHILTLIVLVQKWQKKTLGWVVLAETRVIFVLPHSVQLLIT